MNKKRVTLESREIQYITRRRFLKNASLLMGGVAFSSVAISSACSPSSDTTLPNPTTTTTSQPTTTSNNNTPTNPNTTLPPGEGFVYKTPLEQPPVMEIPGCTTYTATDRKYVIEHMWVKMVAENVVAIGITEKMSELTDWIYRISLPQVGTVLDKNGYFAYFEAAKMNVEFPAPVSGIVMQVNNDIHVDPVEIVNGDPYVRGWLITIQMEKPEEWDELLTPQEYTDLNSKVLPQ